MSRIFVESAHDTPLVSFTIAADVGVAIDPPGVDGFTSHMVELARRGAGKRDRAALDAELDGLGASLSASTTRDSVAFHATCLARNLEATLELAADVLARPIFAASEHEQLLRESGYDLDELRDDDGSLAHRYFNRSCVPGHPYARSAIGTRASQARIELPAVKQRFREVFSRDRVVVGFAGDITEARAEAAAAALTSQLASSEGLSAPTWSGELPTGRRTIVVDKPDRRQSQLMLGHVAPRYGTGDFGALLVAETAFGGMFTSRMMQEIRVKRGWSYGAGCRMLRARLPHWLRMTLAPSAEVTPDALALTLRLYEELAEDGVTADELAFARDHLVGSMAFARATARQRLGQSIRHHLFGLPDDYAETLPARLEALSESEIRGAIDRCLRPADLCIVLVTTAAEMRPRLAELDLGEVTVERFDSY